MGIKNQIGNAISGLKSAWSNTTQEIGSRINAIFDSTTTKIGSIYSGGFIGVDANNWTAIKTSVEDLISAANEDINKFNDLANRDDALKGEAATALGEYLTACKGLLQAYVTTYRNFITDGETALAAMNTGDTENAKAIQQASAEVNEQAQSIQVD